MQAECCCDGRVIVFQFQANKVAKMEIACSDVFLFESLLWPAVTLLLGNISTLKKLSLMVPVKK